MHLNTQTILGFAKKHVVLLLILLGIAVRVIGFPSHPQGLNQDEAIDAYNALTLIREGVEPYKGYSYPVNLLSWGTGGPFIGTAIMMPSIWMFGTTVFAIRLPYLILGLLTLPLFYFFLRKITDRETAILGLFLLVISPWHIALSRWALDANPFPPLLLLGCSLFALWLEKGSWYLLAAMGTFAACLYSYGPAIAVIPILLVFLIPSLIQGYKRHRETGVDFLSPLVLFIIIAIPIALYILINMNILAWETFTIGPVTIPRLDTPSRFHEVGIYGNKDALYRAFANTSAFFRLILTQNDGLVFNVLPRFGIIYGPGMIAALFGMWSVFRKARQSLCKPIWIVVAWFFGALTLAPQLDPNVNRLNALWLPLIVFAAIGLRMLANHPRMFKLVIVYFLLWFFTFLYGYFLTFAPSLQSSFQGNFYRAIRFVHHEVPEGPICITNHASYILVNVVTAAEMPSSVFRENLHGSGRAGRFTFGLQQCDLNSQGYVVTQDEFKSFHGMDERVNVKNFGRFVAVTPRQ